MERFCDMILLHVNTRLHQQTFHYWSHNVGWPDVGTTVPTLGQPTLWPAVTGNGSESKRFSYCIPHMYAKNGPDKKVCFQFIVFLLREICKRLLNFIVFWPFLNTLRPRQNGRPYPDDIFKRIFFNQNVWISIKISLKFVPEVRINNIPALIQIMAWCRPGDKPLSEPMMISLLTHICVTRPQWVN